MVTKKKLLTALENGADPARIAAIAKKNNIVLDDDLPEAETKSTEEKREESRSALLKKLNRAAENGADPKKLQEIAERNGLGANYRASLEREAAQAQAAQADADRRLRGSQDSIVENLLEGAGEIATRANAAAMFMGDVATSPFRAVGKAAGLIPEEVTGLADLFPEGYQPGRGEFMEEREVAPYVGLAGDALAMGGAMAPVARAQGTGAAIAEAAGLGMTDDIAGAGSRAAQINMENAAEINRLNTMNPDEYFDDLERAGSIDIDNDAQVQHFANKLNDEIAFEANAGRLDDLIEDEAYTQQYSEAFRSLDEEAQALEAKLNSGVSRKEKATLKKQIAANEAKRQELVDSGDYLVKINTIESRIDIQRAKLADENATLEEVEKANEVISKLTKEKKKLAKKAPSKVRYTDPAGKTKNLKLKYNPQTEEAAALADETATAARMAERFGISEAEATRAIARSGGLKPAQTYAELGERQASSMKELFRGGDGSTVSIADKIWRPVTALVRDKVGRGAARDFEQAFESAARDSELMYRNYVHNPSVAKALNDWMDSDGVKQRFMNLHRTGKAGLKELREMAKQDLDPRVVDMFEMLVKQSSKHNASTGPLFKDSVRSDAVRWASEVKPQEMGKLEKVKASFRKPEVPANRIDGAMTRVRGDAFDMTPEELARYESPMIAQLNRMNEEITGKHLAERFGVRSSVGKNGNMNDLFNEIERTAQKSGASPETAATLRGAIADTYAGQKAAPPSWMQTFMKQSYAGTLGQVDSAMMNLHDIAVSAWRMGPKNTSKALWDSLFDSSGEIDLRRMGITNTNNSVTEFREGVGRALQQTSRLDRAVETYADYAFKYSGFQMMDRLGKGTTMRAALHQFRDDAAKRGFVRDYAHLVKPGEAAQVKAALASGTKLSDMTAKQQDIVERMMFAKLGEQQLISAAGRPLLYLQVPAARPLWAMTGFAVKQMDMLKMAVYDEARNGNWSAAGKAAVGYMTYVAVGYAIVDTVRNMPAYAITGDDSKGPQKFGSRVIDQPLAAATLNRVDTRTFGRTANDPVGETLKSLAPPGGMIGNVGKDVGRAATGKEFRGYFLKSIPGGDFLYDMFND